MDPTEVPMLNINGEKPEVAAEKKNQYLATVAGKRENEKRQEKELCVLWFSCNEQKIVCLFLLFYFILFGRGRG